MSILRFLKELTWNRNAQKSAEEIKTSTHFSELKVRKTILDKAVSNILYTDIQVNNSNPLQTKKNCVKKLRNSTFGVIKKHWNRRAVKRKPQQRLSRSAV